VRAAKPRTPPSSPVEALFIEMIRKVVREELAGREPDQLEKLVETLPLTARRVNALARSGAIEGAEKIGRSWVARRSAIDAYLEARRTERAERKVKTTPIDEVADLLARAGWKVSA